MSSSMLTVPRYDKLRQRTAAPPGSSWCLFGPDDQLGTLNLLTARTARDGAGLVRHGRVVNLDCPLNAFVPSLAGSRPPAEHQIFAHDRHNRDDWLGSCSLRSTSQVDRVYEFPLTAKPLNPVGGVGSPTNALAAK